MNERIKAYKKGIWAERLAALSLMLQGYAIAARRFKTPVGEVDIIARKKDFVVFVEVKARQDIQSALDSVTPSAKARIEAASQWWLSKQKDAGQLSWRFDVIVALPRRLPVHYKDVW